MGPCMSHCVTSLSRGRPWVPPKRRAWYSAMKLAAIARYEHSVVKEELFHNYHKLEEILQMRVLNPWSLSSILRSFTAPPSPASSAARLIACGQTGWLRRQSMASRPNTLLVSKGVMTLVPGTEVKPHPRRISWISRTPNSTTINKSEDVHSLNTPRIQYQKNIN